ncbi:MAG TPA: DUF4846 domain-containing protein [Puia sp.]|nr:DUF4846 domain-containing protein [Puia sp.]
MKPNLGMAIILPVFAVFFQSTFSQDNLYATIKDIPIPAGYSRITTVKNSFVDWLRNLPLKKDKTVYLYNGYPKRNQTAQFAVINISVGNKDLQQCADAIMRLRAEYLYKEKRYVEIVFWDNNHHALRLGANKDQKEFDKYLENVFARCGTISLETQLTKLQNLNDLKPGDVLIQGGSPGHAMIVMDVAINKSGKKIFLLAQSYMPAQDIHVVINPMNHSLSPWFELNNHNIITPEWCFQNNHFRTWE